MDSYEMKMRKEAKSAWRFAGISTLAWLAIGIFIFIMDANAGQTSILGEILATLWLIGLCDSCILAGSFPPGSRGNTICWIVLGLTFFGGMFLAPFLAH